MIESCRHVSVCSPERRVGWISGFGAHAARALRHVGLAAGEAAAGDAVAVDAVHAKHEARILCALAVLRPLRGAARTRVSIAVEASPTPRRAFLQSSGCLSSHVFGMPSCMPLNFVVCILRAQHWLKLFVA